MTIHLKHNPYVGLNAHHLSLLQNIQGDWESFHAVHITHLWEALNQQLPDGYLARSERSIQISSSASDTPSSRIRPDVLVLQIQPETSTVNSALEAIPSAVFALEDTLVSVDEYPDAVLIYHVKSGGLIGKPVTRIELLSPSNKPPQQAAQKYLQKRDETLQSGIALVELDYLHQSPSILTAFPDLAQNAYPAPNSFPYQVIVSDPFPTIAEGTVQVFGIGVDEPFSAIPIPLGFQKAILFDLGVVYNYTFARDAYAHAVLDYEQVPMKFESYHPADQERIRQRMNRIVESKV